MLLTLSGVIAVKSVEFILRRGRHDCKMEGAERARPNTLANRSEGDMLDLWDRVSAIVVQVWRNLKSARQEKEGSLEDSVYVRQSD